METTAPAREEAAISGQAPLYIQPEPLNPEQHGKLGLKFVDNPYGGGATHHFMPILGPEIPAAACCYPIIFAGEDKGPLAVMGLNQGENLFYTDGVVRPDVYLPAYLRRYPFTVAFDAPANRMVICIDRKASMVTENPDLPFFEGGELSQYSKNCIEFCENFERDRGLTEQFVGKMKALDLFEEREATFNPPPGPNGEQFPTQTVAGFNAISETKLNALPPETIRELFELGYLRVIYAHLTSMMHWDRLIAMALKLRGEEAEKAQKIAAAPAKGKKN